MVGSPESRKRHVFLKILYDALYSEIFLLLFCSLEILKLALGAEYSSPALSAADLREVVDLQLLFVSLDGLGLFSRLSLLLQLLHGRVVQFGVDLLCQLLGDGLG